MVEANKQNARTTVDTAEPRAECDVLHRLQAIGLIIRLSAAA
jgi:hypothetical protein